MTRRDGTHDCVEEDPHSDEDSTRSCLSLISPAKGRSRKDSPSLTIHTLKRLREPIGPSDSARSDSTTLIILAGRINPWRRSFSEMLRRGAAILSARNEGGGVRGTAKTGGARCTGPSLKSSSE